MSDKRGNKIYQVPSDILKQLRPAIQTLNGMAQALGNAVQFRLVADTNVVLGDIRWLAHKRRDVSARTNLMETTEAGTIELYVPTALLNEMDEKIEVIAREENLRF